jgi:hypothetical protein
VRHPSPCGYARVCRGGTTTSISPCITHKKHKARPWFNPRPAHTLHQLQPTPHPSRSHTTCCGPHPPRHPRHARTLPNARHVLNRGGRGGRWLTSRRKSILVGTFGCEPVPKRKSHHTTHGMSARRLEEPLDLAPPYGLLRGSKANYLDRIMRASKECSVCEPSRTKVNDGPALSCPSMHMMCNKVGWCSMVLFWRV